MAKAGNSTKVYRMELLKNNRKIEDRIFSIRGKQVILDRDLAQLYGVEVSQMNRQIRRNIERFPEDFMFQLNTDEWNGLKCQNGTSNSRGGDRAVPNAFTEQGVSMLAGLLRSPIAIEANIQIIRAFVADLVRKAARRIVLIDNYIDDTVLTLLDKREVKVDATIYTSRISQQLQLDITRHNAQYTPIDVKIFSKAHDRFLIIDDKVYLIGASIKDLGKKWFGFTLMENTDAEELIGKL